MADPQPPITLRGDEADAFEAHHDRLISVLRRRVCGPDVLIEDAVSITWITFMRVQPRRGPELFSWLLRVAEREAWRLGRIAVKIEPADAGGVALDDVAATVEARVRVRDAAAAMTERQRRMIGLHAAGFRYDEIAALTDATPRTVERQIERGRRRARAA